MVGGALRPGAGGGGRGVIGRALEAASLAVAGTATVAMTALVVLAVVMRYAVGAPLVYSYDLSVILFAWAIFAGLALAELRGSHLAVDVIDRAVPERVAGLLFRTRQVALAGLSLWFAWLGWSLVERAGMTIPSLRVSIRWLYAAMPVGFAALALAQLVRAFGPVPAGGAAAPGEARPARGPVPDAR